MSVPVPAAALAALLPLFAHLVELFNQVAALPDARGVESLVHEGLREARCRHCGEWAELLETARGRTMISVRGEVRGVYASSTNAMMTCGKITMKTLQRDRMETCAPEVWAHLDQATKRSLQISSQSSFLRASSSSN
ncbi:hypothetical protein JXA32_17560, partial [Candidatus Sumerlaeota bacterium]|nr:hypothetical protein [Candidatus Sumerlaeota bacterium]